MEIIKEWEKIFKDNSVIYIYGALLNAERLYRVALKTGVVTQIAGFAVTHKEGNPSNKFGLPVVEVAELNNADVFLLVPQQGVAKKEISLLLDKMGKNYCYAAKYLKILNENNSLHDDEWKKTEIQVKRLDYEKTQREREKDKNICGKILEILKDGNPDFGGDEAYQSLEQIGLKGFRPTLYRINKYGLKKYLEKDKTVLDIGCNTGFIDLSISSFVKKITGVEYDKSLIIVANLAKDYLNIKNVEFLCNDFEKWYLENSKESFDIIFSFAVHHWLNIDFYQYIDIIDGLLNINGIVCFESQSYDPDTEFDLCIELLLKKDYLVQDKGTIIDDGTTMRKFYILQKMS